MQPYYECDNTTIYHGDCIHVMSTFCDKSFDMICVDLPYGTTVCKWDVIIPFAPLWEQYERIIKDNGAIVMTACQPFTSALVMSNPTIFKYQWIWVKTKKTGFTNAKNRPLSQHEDVLVFSKGSVANRSKVMMKYNPQGLQPLNKVRKGNKNKSDGDAVGHKYHRPSQSQDYVQSYTNYPTTVLHFPSVGKNLHPTQKPVSLFEYLIKTYTDSGDLVLDNAMGSGTTLVAARNLGRRVVGIDVNEDYCKMAVTRLNT